MRISGSDAVAGDRLRGFNPEHLRAELKPLDLSSRPIRGDAETNYLAYYNLGVQHNDDEVVHHFGTLRCAGMEIATHYYVHPKPRGTCILVHGYFDHSGLYGHLIRHCLDAGYSVMIHDLPGHGMSSGAPAAIDSFDRYLTAFTEVLEQLGDRMPMPWVAIGQSTGGAILMKYLIWQRARPSSYRFAKTVLLAPLVRPVGWRSGKLLYPLLNPFRRSIPRKFVINSGDPVFQRFLLEDPLQSDRLPLSWVGAMYEWVRDFEATGSGHEAIELIQGGADTTVDWRGNLPMIRLRFPKTNITMVEGAAHHMVNERIELRERIFSLLPL